jgi:hypothetical protein
MATYTYINASTKHLADGVHNLSADQLKIAFSNTALSAGMTVLSNVTQIASGNNYAAGGFNVTTSSSKTSGSTYVLRLTDKVFTASGGSVGPFRYIVLYNSASSGLTNALLGWWDYGSALTLADGETLTLDFLATEGVIQIPHA